MNWYLAAKLCAALLSFLVAQLPVKSPPAVEKESSAAGTSQEERQVVDFNDWSDFAELLPRFDTGHISPPGQPEDQSRKTKETTTDSPPIVERPGRYPCSAESDAPCLVPPVIPPPPDPLPPPEPIPLPGPPAPIPDPIWCDPRIMAFPDAPISDCHPDPCPGPLYPLSDRPCLLEAHIDPQ